jgi:asparagine synthase (glutamine-hydrolysing)
MCGIIGLYHKGPGTAPPAHPTRAILDRMLGTLAHRGPDETGVAELGRCWLGHARLSIIDLTTGSQPVYNEDGSVAVVLNGEIYNYLDLRKTLESAGHRFHTTSDTEVLVHGYEQYGEDFLSHLNGMFAIVLYDRRSDTLLVARDRLGEKPVLYAETENTLAVASELKALLQHPAVGREIDQDAVALYLSTSYVPAPYSIFKGIRKLPPAHYLTVKNGRVAMKQYWRPTLASVADRSTADTCERFVELFSDAVRIRLLADVPIGVFLSGGIDSSAVTAFMAQAATSVKTFTVGFADDIDERPFARQVADRYHTEHSEIFLKTDLASVVGTIFDYMDEPFGDSSIVPTYVVSREARKSVKVILTGDGGDELFAGYTSYLSQRSRRASRLATQALSWAYSAVDGTPLSRLLDAVYPRRGASRARGAWLNVRTLFDDREIGRMVGTSGFHPRQFFDQAPWLPVSDRDPLSMAFEFDLNYYLPDDLLKKVDMASMCASLECRAPFLDHRIVEFAFTIPAILKVRGGSPKHILKQALEPYLPHDILHREKTGFGAPVAAWVRQRLREPVLDLLRPGALIEQFVRRDAIKSLLTRCFDPRAERDASAAYGVWLLFVLERWMCRYTRADLVSRESA